MGPPAKQATILFPLNTQKIYLHLQQKCLDRLQGAKLQDYL